MTRIDEAARLLVQARRGPLLGDGLPESCRPGSVDDAHAIQQAVSQALGDPIAGWKIATSPEGRTIRGALLQSRVWDDGAIVPAGFMTRYGIELEIAFRVEQGFPARAAEYTYEEVAAGVMAFPAIEIVDSRFAGYPKVPMTDRLADCNSNGGFVRGADRPAWRSSDLAALEAELIIDGGSVVKKLGGHVTKDPLLPAIALVNDLRTGAGVPAGTLLTTGTFTGIHFARAGQTVRGVFHGFGEVGVRL